MTWYVATSIYIGLATGALPHPDFRFHLANSSDCIASLFMGTTLRYGTLIGKSYIRVLSPSKQSDTLERCMEDPFKFKVLTKHCL